MQDGTMSCVHYGSEETWNLLLYVCSETDLKKITSQFLDPGIYAYIL